jgi:hypothetical protein
MENMLLQLHPCGVVVVVVGSALSWVFAIPSDFVVALNYNN